MVCSTSIEEILSPPEMLMSLPRSRSSTFPSGCHAARSPEWNQPPLRVEQQRSGALAGARERRVHGDEESACSRKQPDVAGVSNGSSAVLAATLEHRTPPGGVYQAVAPTDVLTPSEVLNITSA